jgi:hypothetical protein
MKGERTRPMGSNRYCTGNELRARARIMELTDYGNPMEMMGVVLSPSDGDRRCQNRRDPVEA